MQELTWKVGGAQGEGIDSTGEILGTVLNQEVTTPLLTATLCH